ncbi:hypothetical protein C8Q77DRAFT_1120978 [Trametes polyzona]|nr:hypothetical protein C8Q77DRAFT_1120978 [Trametes polyzona]
MGSSRSTFPAYISSYGYPTSESSSWRGAPATHRHHRGQPIRASYTIPRPPPPNVFSNDSSPGVPASLWFADDFMLGAGMVIIQPSTGKVVVLSDEDTDERGQKHIQYFLPKGRKDVGESLEQTALREAYEESGYRVSFLPLIIPSHAPNPTGAGGTVHRWLPSSEPIYLHLYQWSRGHYGRDDTGGEYLTLWYVGQIGPDAVVETGTRMPDEVGYQTHLVSREEAMRLLHGGELLRIVDKAYQLFEDTRARIQDPDWQQFLRNVLGVDPAVYATWPNLELEGPVLAYPVERTAEEWYEDPPDGEPGNSQRAAAQPAL